MIDFQLALEEILPVHGGNCEVRGAARIDLMRGRDVCVGQANI